MSKRKKPEIKNLYYVTHIENIPSIISHGILSHQLIEDRDIKYKAIYDIEIVGNRKQKKTPDGHSLWDFANVYFQATEHSGSPHIFNIKYCILVYPYCLLKIKKMG